jgi:hypothetical protein
MSGTQLRTRAGRAPGPLAGVPAGCHTRRCTGYQASETTSGQETRQTAPHQAADPCASTTHNPEPMQPQMAPPAIYGVDPPKSAAGDRIDNQQPAVASKRPDRWLPQVQDIQQEAMGTDEGCPPPCQSSVPSTGARLPESPTFGPGP